MINESKAGQDIFQGDENVIVFAINTEGYNDSGFAGMVSSRYWPELANTGELELGTVLEREADGKRFCGIVCHSLKNGWGTPEEQTRTIKECFDKIQVGEGDRIASIAIGNGLIGRLSGADYEAILEGMSQSDREVCVYGAVPERLLEREDEELSSDVSDWEKNYRKEEKEREASAKAKIPEWIKKGENLVYPEKMEKWEECVRARADDLYHGLDLEDAIAIMEKLENGASIDEAKKLFDEQNHSGMSASMVRRIVLYFSEKGPDFYESTAWGELSDDEKEAIDEVRKENEEYQKNSRKEEVEERTEQESIESSEESSSKIGEVLGKLDEIKSRGLDEKEFYAEVLKTITEMEYPDKKEFEEVKAKLFAIGCKMYKDWAAEKEEEGIIDPNYTVGEGISKADLGTAIGMINQLMYDFENVGWSFERVQYWGKDWLEEYARQREGQEPEELGDETAEKEINVDDDRFTSMDQILKEIEELGDWRDPAEKDKYLKFMAKSISIYYGVNRNGKRENFPETIKAIAWACKASGKFPTEEEVFVDGKLAPGLNTDDVFYYNWLANFSTPLGISFLGERVPMDDLAREKFGIDVLGLEMTTKESKQLEDSAKKYYAENFDKTTIPYYKVAKAALMNWNGMSEQEADDFIRRSTFEEIEAQVGAKNSMQYAIDGIAKSAGLSKYEKEELEAMIFNGKPSPFAEGDITKKVVENTPVDVLMDSMATVHDGWVKDNGPKFFKRDKKYQHMPFELIGWKEAEADLLFVKPIFEAMKVGISRPLEQDYNRRARRFFLDKGITDSEKLVELIQTGDKFYPALSGQNDIIEALSDKEFVETTVYPQIIEKGIGEVEAVRRGISADIAIDPNPEDLEKLTDREREELDKSLEKEIEKEEAKDEKARTIEKILEKSMRLKELRLKNKDIFDKMKNNIDKIIPTDDED